MLLLTSVLGKELMLTVGMIPDRPWCCVVSYIWTVVQGGLWYGSRTKKVTNHESQISNFHFSFESHNQHVKYRFLSCAYAKRKVVKEFLKNSSKLAKRKSKTANSNLQKFIIFI